MSFHNRLISTAASDWGRLLAFLALATAGTAIGFERAAQAQADAAPAVAESPKAGEVADLSEAESAQLIQQLDDADFLAREHAERQLHSAPPSAVPLLIKAARQGNLETLVRATAVLAHMAEAAPAERARQARQGLQSLAELSVTSAGRRAAEYLEVLARRDEELALKQIVTLGAAFGAADNFTVGAEANSHVVLTKQWRGGNEQLELLTKIPSLEQVSLRGCPIDDQGAAHLRKLKNVRRLEIYGTRITPKGLEQLRDALPNVDIDFRRGGLLGVSGSPEARPCRLSLVRENSAAAKAGLHHNDVILACDDIEIETFRGLTEIVSEKGPGDKLKLLVDRDGQRLEFTAILGEWE